MLQHITVCNLVWPKLMVYVVDNLEKIIRKNSVR